MVLSQEDSIELTVDRDFPSQWEKKLTERYFLEGSLHQMREEYGEAITQFRHVLRFAPGNSAVHFAIARCYHALGKIDSALSHADRAIELDDDNIDARSQYADLLMANGRIGRAVQQYEEIVRRQPNNLQARYNAARLQQRSSPDRSITHYEYIRRNLGDDYNALLNLAELYMNRRSFDNAAEVIRELIFLDAANPDLYRILADAYLHGERYEDAAGVIAEMELHVIPDSLLEEVLIEELNNISENIEASSSDGMLRYATDVASRVATRYPRRWETSYYSGLIRFRAGDSVAADSLLLRALSHRASPVNAWTEAATIYIDNGASERALRFLSATANRHKNNARVPFLIGYAFFNLSRHDSAEKYLKRSLAIREDNGEAWGQLALIYNRQGKPAASDAAYEKAILFDPDNPSILNNYAYALAQSGRRLDHALSMVNHALDREPENESFLDTKGWIYFKLQDYERALQYIQRSVDIGGASFEVLEHLGDTHRALGDIPSARDAYVRALRLSPQNKELLRKLEEME